LCVRAMTQMQRRHAHTGIRTLMGTHGHIRHGYVLTLPLMWALIDYTRSKLREAEATAAALENKGRELAAAVYKLKDQRDALAARLKESRAHARRRHRERERERERMYKYIYVCVSKVGPERLHVCMCDGYIAAS
jgi:hypothetical protein